jgi:hypothetical protein
MGALHCAAARAARHRSIRGASAGQNVVGIEVLKGAQRLLARVLERQQQAWREPVLARSTAMGGARRGW